MAPRKTRGRKTADKMAVYKAAAAARNRQVPDDHVSPRLTSPNGSQRTSPRSSYRTSPRKLVGKSVTNSDRGNKKAVDSATNLGKKGAPNLASAQITVNQVVKKKEGNFEANGSHESESSGDEEFVPETPPPKPAPVGRKRIIAPMTLEFSDMQSDDDVGEVGKPTKKRKLFNTPPRKESETDSAVGAAECISLGHTPDRTSFPFMNNSRIEAENELEPLLDSAQKNVHVGDGVDETFRAPSGLMSTNQIAHARSATHTKSLTPCPITERSAPATVSLDMLTTSSATLTQMFESFARKVTAEIDEVRKANEVGIQKIGDTLNDTVSSEIRNIQSLFEMITGARKSGARLMKTSNTSLRDWEKALDGLTSCATVIFGKDLFSRILSFNAPLKAVDTYFKYLGCDISDVKKCSMSAQTLLFRLQPTDKKFQYLDDIGKLHSDFNFSVVRNTFYNVHLDSFGLFKERNAASTGSGTMIHAAAGVGQGKLDRPSWLEKGFVSNDHIIEARAFTETSGQSRKEKVRRKPTPDYVACHGALRVYRQLGKVLHDGRGNMRVSFFQSLGYLFVQWKGSVADTDQSTLKLHFLVNEQSSHDVLSLSLDDVPLAQQCAQNADSSTVSTADSSNKRILKELFCALRDMILRPQHEVLVTQPGQQKNGRRSPEKKVLHRLVNIIDVALDCCVEFCRVGSREIFMRSSKTSFRCVMIFATLFKALSLEFMEMSSISSNSAVESIPCSAIVVHT